MKCMQIQSVVRTVNPLVKHTYLWGYLVMMLSVTTLIQAQACHGHLFDLVCDIDPQGFYPITVGQNVVVKGTLPDTPNPSSSYCHCPLQRHPGVASGFWLPVLLVEITRHPGCLVSLGGKRLPLGYKHQVGDISHYSARNNQNFYTVHVYQLPTAKWFPKLFGGNCHGSKHFGLVYASEWDPNWSKDVNLTVHYPELMPYLKKLKQANAMNAADCMAANVKLPLDRVYWNAGCHGY